MWNKKKRRKNVGPWIANIKGGCAAQQLLKRSPTKTSFGSLLIEASLRPARACARTHTHTATNLSILHQLIEFLLECQKHLFKVAILLLEGLHLALEGGVLFLEVAGAHGDLVLLEPARLTRPLSRLVVLGPLGPILVVLQLVGDELLLSLSDNWLRFEFLFREASCGWVEVLKT